MTSPAPELEQHYHRIVFIHGGVGGLSYTSIYYRMLILGTPEKGHTADTKQLHAE